MFIRFTESLCLNDWGDIIEIKYNDLNESYATFKLNQNEVAYTNNKIEKIFTIQPDDVFLITTEQHYGGKIKGNTSCEMFIQKSDSLILIDTFFFGEPTQKVISDVKAYKLVEYIAKRISEKYGITWKFKSFVDTPEKQALAKRIKVVGICLMTVIVIYGIIEVIKIFTLL